jgi:hypothetical protein
MARRVRHRNRRSSGSLHSRGRTGRTIGWRAVLTGAPLAYGGGTLAGDLLAVALGASTGIVISGTIVVLACVLASAGLDRVIDRWERPRSRSLSRSVSARTSMAIGATVLVPSVLFGFGLALV